MVDAPVERVFFDSGGVKVTNARLVGPGATYAMSSITSVSHETEAAKLGLPITFVALGALALCIGGVAFIAGRTTGYGCAAAFLFFGLLFLAIGGFLFKQAHPLYYVLLATSAGQVRTISSQDPKYTGAIAAAINDALAARG